MIRILLILLVSMGFISAYNCGDVPILNKSLVNLAEKKTKKKVGSGECWDLIKYALDESGAKWDGYQKFGKLFNPKKECIFPGDIIQFERVKIHYTEGDVSYKESMFHHTAIVAKVISQNEVVLVHQNTGHHGRRVGKSNLRLDTVTSGEMIFYRPVEK